MLARQEMVAATAGEMGVEPGTGAMAVSAVLLAVARKGNTSLDKGRPLS